MHLTLINFFKRTVPGHVFRGKRRLVMQPTRKTMKQLIRKYEIQEQNMKYLLKPYITLEQSQGHAKDLGKTEAKLNFWNNNPIKPPFKPHIKIEDRLIHLKCSEAWD